MELYFDDYTEISLILQSHQIEKTLGEVPLPIIRNFSPLSWML